MKIIFEKIRLIHLPRLLYYIWRGDEIRVFDFSHDLKKRFWMRWLIHAEKIKRIYTSPFDPSHGEAIDQMEKDFVRLRKTEKSIPILTWLYGSAEIEDALKRALLQGTFESISMRRYLQTVPGPAVFIPDGGFWKAFFAGIDILLWFAYLFLKLAFLALRRILFMPKPEKTDATYAFALSSPFEIKFKNKRGFDFLLDHSRISKNNSVFLIWFPVAGEWLSARRREGYRLVEARRFSGWPGPGSLRAWRQLLGCGSDKSPVLSAALRLLHYYIQYRLVSEHLSFRHYVYTNLESPKQIALNILIRKSGAESWNYSHFIGGAFLYAKGLGEMREKRHILWAFLNSDHYLGVNEDVIRYHRSHCQTVRHYHPIGNIYSEMVRETVRALPEKKSSGKKRIAFFDTSYIDANNCLTTFDDAIAFYRDILRLVEERKDLSVIVKPAKEEAYFVSPRSQWSSGKKGKEILSLWKTLRNREGVCWAGNDGDMPSIMAESDLVITHCLSSPTVEALGAGKKAVWYEPGFKHTHFLYQDVPNLILHGYEELKGKLDHFLYEMDDEQWTAFLKRHIEGRVEYRVDGLALTRFRNLLWERI